MKLSARNQLPGTVRTVTTGQVMAEVVVDVAGGHEVVARSRRVRPPARPGAREAYRCRRQVDRSDDRVDD